MSEATLALRPRESVLCYEDIPEVKPGERVYLVALLKAPAFPGEQHAACTSLVVAAAEQYRVQPTGDTAWGWIHLTPETKREIGDLLTNGKAEADKWYYAVVLTEEQFKQRTGGT